MTSAGLPHSGIPGSTPADGSPRLFAAFHALHRLMTPRHPPCAFPSSAPALTHDAKPTGSTHSSPLFYLSRYRPSTIETYRRPLIAGPVDRSLSSRLASDRCPLSCRTDYELAGSTRSGSDQQKRPDLHRTATTPPSVPIRTSLRSPLQFAAASDRLISVLRSPCRRRSISIADCAASRKQPVLTACAAVPWWRWADSNPRPPACKAALSH